jgi:hypothetical protein
VAILALAAATTLGTGLGTARGDTPADDEVPSGAVAFFGGGACPEGWAPADEVEGRPVVGVTEGANVGVTVGAPLGDREDRTHEHPFSGNVALSGKGAFATDGSNNDGAAARSYVVKGATSAKTSGLAFVQVQACAKL